MNSCWVNLRITCVVSIMALATPYGFSKNSYYYYYIIDVCNAICIMSSTIFLMARNSCTQLHIKSHQKVVYAHECVIVIEGIYFRGEKLLFYASWMLYLFKYAKELPWNRLRAKIFFLNDFSRKNA